jgi:hypothetical protein
MPPGPHLGLGRRRACRCCGGASLSALLHARSPAAAAAPSSCCAARHTRARVQSGVRARRTRALTGPHMPARARARDSLTPPHARAAGHEQPGVYLRAAGRRKRAVPLCSVRYRAADGGRGRRRCGRRRCRAAAPLRGAAGARHGCVTWHPRAADAPASAACAPSLSPTGRLADPTPLRRACAPPRHHSRSAAGRGAGRPGSSAGGRAGRSGTGGPPDAGGQRRRRCDEGGAHA